jgi:hypothetical protein
MFPSQFEVATLATAHHAQELRLAREREWADQARDRAETVEPAESPRPSPVGWRNLVRALVQRCAQAATAGARQ